MTITAIKVPKWGLAMTEGSLVAWHKAPGDRLSKGEDLADIESSKIANVLEAPADGILRRQTAAVGDLLPVGALLGVITDGDESDAEIGAFVADYQTRFAAEAAAEAAAAPVPQKIEAAGQSLQYLKLAPADFEGGVPLLLIHGFGGDLNNWLFNHAELARERAVYAIDLPGHGGSTKAIDDASFEGLAATILAALDALGLERVALAGHSLGGALALELALRHPERVHAVVTLCAAGFGDAPNTAYIEGFLKADKRKDLKPAAELLFANKDLVTRDMLEDMIRFKRLDGVAAALGAIAAHALSAIPDFRDRLGDLKAPLLALFGAEDRVIALPDLSTLGGRAHVLPDSGHMAHMEAAQEVNRLIDAFLAEQD